jgi:CubicO group peptidase (beta-lactamase class C family)
MPLVLIRLLAGFSLLFSLCAAAAPRVPPPPPAAPAAAIEQLAQLMKHARVGGAALAKIEGGRLAWVAVRGERAPGQPVTADTVFNVASLTKPLFATVFMHQVAAGRIDLDTPLVRDWVDPDIAADPRRLALTARLALSHQGGFANWRGGEPLRFAFAPGERDEYSGEGYEYARRALEHRTGRSLGRLAQDSVFAPAGMVASHLGWDARLADNLAVGFDEHGQPLAAPASDGLPPSAAAHLLTTIGDYGRFAAWFARGADLPPALWRQMQQPQARHANPSERFGLGWHLIESGGDVALWHDGRETGVRSLVVLLPRTGDGLVLLTNSDNGELMSRPLIASQLAQGEAINAALDRDVWTYLQRMPREQVAGVAHAIAGSPAFLERLLHAVHTTQLATADLPEADRQAALAAIDAYVQAVRDGAIEPEQAWRLVAQLLVSPESAPAWRATLDGAQRRAWIAALAERSVGRADRVPRVVAPELLARYVGQYRVPSSNLLVTIERHEQSLRASAPGMPPITLLGMSDAMFFMREDDTRFEFVADADGKVEHLRLLWRGGRSELAQRER